jgi:hypothetical protein
MWPAADRVVGAAGRRSSLRRSAEPGDRRTPGASVFLDMVCSGAELENQRIRHTVAHPLRAMAAESRSAHRNRAGRALGSRTPAIFTRQELLKRSARPGLAAILDRARRKWWTPNSPERREGHPADRIAQGWAGRPRLARRSMLRRHPRTEDCTRRFAGAIAVVGLRGTGRCALHSTSVPSPHIAISISHRDGRITTIQRVGSCFPYVAVLRSPFFCCCR